MKRAQRPSWFSSADILANERGTVNFDALAAAQHAERAVDAAEDAPP